MKFLHYVLLGHRVQGVEARKFQILLESWYKMRRDLTLKLSSNQVGTLIVLAVKWYSWISSHFVTLLKIGMLLNREKHEKYPKFAQFQQSSARKSEEI